MERPLEGKVAVVTGASRGLGAFSADVLAGAGANVAICGRSTTPLTEVAAEIERRHTRRVVTATCDVSDPANVAAFAEHVMDALGPADVLINNAGVLGPVGPLHTVDAHEWSETLIVNVGGVASVTAAFLPAMLERGSGSIVNLSGGGVGGPRPAERVSAYASSKFAVVGFTEAVASELAGSGVRVNAVAPGGVWTGFDAPILAAGPEVAGRALYEAATSQEAEPAPMEPFGQLLLFLASDESSWLSGRLLSARWEDPGRLQAARPRIEGTSLFKLRRIDDALFTEVTRDSSP